MTLHTPLAPTVRRSFSTTWFLLQGRFLSIRVRVSWWVATSRAQTQRVLENVSAILAAAGASLQTVIKTTVYLADMGEFTAMNEVYTTHFGDHKPARSTVQAARLPGM